MANNSHRNNKKSYAFLWLSDLFLSLGISAISFGFSALFLANGATTILTDSGVLAFGVSSAVIGIVLLPVSALFKVLGITNIEHNKES